MIREDMTASLAIGLWWLGVACDIPDPPQPRRRRIPKGRLPRPRLDLTNPHQEEKR